MVQNRNWQDRVEAADARRKESRQRKQRSEEKRIFKSMMQEVLALLDCHSAAIRHRSNSDASDYSADSQNEDNPTFNTGSSLWDLHLWTDSIPSESLPYYDVEHAEEWKPSRRSRSASLNDIPPAVAKILVRKGRDRSGPFPKDGTLPKGREGRARSGSFPQEAAGTPCKKSRPRSSKQREEWSGSLGDTPQQCRAGHPRSNSELIESDLHDSNYSMPLLCKNHFFFGTCTEFQKGGKKGSCRFFHCNNKQSRTLGAVLGRHRSTSNGRSPPEKSLLEASNSVRELAGDISNSDRDGMPMVHYMTIPIPNGIGQSLPNPAHNSDDGLQTFISDLVTQKLNANSCSIASIVYMVISTPTKDVLLYDRNRDGLVISDFMTDILADERDISTSSHNETNPAEGLPISILEHILGYSDAPTVAYAAQVCKAWNREIGHASPNLWRHMLEKRSWPLPQLLVSNGMNTLDSRTSTAVLHEEDTSMTVTKQLRDEFIKHYSLIRDVRAIQSALTGLLAKRSTDGREMTYQNFSARRGSPQTPNHCVDVKVWGPNRVLAAYSFDCTLRLFQAVSKDDKDCASGRLHQKYCREVVCQSIDPYRGTKKKNCFIEAMELDEDVVGCLCSVSNEMSDHKIWHVLIVIKRDELLVTDSSANEASGRIAEPAEGSLCIIDIEEAVMNYILCLDFVDHRLLRLQDFLAAGGHVDEVEIIVSRSIAACGHGRFMVEVAISIPVLDEEDLAGDEDSLTHMEEMMLLLDRKLFLFSSSLGAIVWMGESHPPDELLRPRLEDMTIVSLRNARSGDGTRNACAVASVSNAVAPIVMSCEIDSSGHVEGNFAFGSSVWSQRERIEEEGWAEHIEKVRPVVVTPTDIVVGDTLTRQQNENGPKEFKAIVTFYSRRSEAKSNLKSKLSVGENCMIDRMVGCRDDYVVLICRLFGKTNHGLEAEHQPAQVDAITIHVPSRRAIDRTCLYEDYGNNKLCLSVGGNTVVCGVWLKGLIMSGDDVRSVGTRNATQTIVEQDVSPAKASKSKKGKTRCVKGRNVKDGFVRGLTMRG